MRFLRGKLWLLPAIGIVVFAMLVGLHNYLLLDYGFPDIAKMSVRRARGEAAFMLWSIASVTTWIAALGSILYSANLLRKLQFPTNDRRLLIVFGAGWILAALVIHFGSDLAGAPGRVLLGAINQEYRLGGPVDLLMQVSTKLAIVAIGLVACALCGLAHPINSTTPQELAKRAKEFNELLYLTAGLMLSGMLLIFSLFRWGALSIGGVEPDVASTIANGIVLGAGVFYTVLLGVAFLPVAVAQQSMLENLTTRQAQETPDLDIPRWRIATGLDFSPLTTLKTYLMMASPLLSGAFTLLIRGQLT